jgi:hypothetical protein
LEHLLSLEHVSLKIFVDHTTPKEVEAVEDEIRKALDMNPWQSPHGPYGIPRHLYR